MTDNKGIVSAENAVGDIEDVKSTLKAAEYGGGMDVSANLLDALASAPDAPDTTHKVWTSYASELSGTWSYAHAKGHHAALSCMPVVSCVHPVLNAVCLI